MKKFDHVVEIFGVKFLCFGIIDPDGFAEIDMVRLEDSKINIWPSLNLLDTKLGIACDKYVVELEGLPNE